MESHSYVENIVHRDALCAIVLRANQVKNFSDSKEKFYFYTPENFPFQAGLQNRRAGDQVVAHFHKPLLDLGNLPVQEFLYVLSGKAVVDLYYTEDSTGASVKVAEVLLGKGDSIILNTGHGVTFLEDTQFINIKQGPYRGRDEEKIFVGAK